jgi:L-lysine exporter family protein LysE/ArgO
MLIIHHLLNIISGMLFVLAVIAGIGPQNLNTISHGIKKNYPYVVATTCFIADGSLVLVGCIGLNITSSKILNLLITVIGAIFICYYLFVKIKSLISPHSRYKISSEVLSKKQAVIRALALTWLNPLVFIDTIIIIGGASSHFTGLNLLDFIIGALLGDLTWLFGLSYISQKLSYKLNRPKVWLFLDISTILIMLFILYKTITFIKY